METSDPGADFLDAEAEKRPDVKSALDYAEEVHKLWVDGLPAGDKTGWPSLDKHYTVAPGQLTIITGWPGSGKSEWTDALMVNLSRQNWKFAICSFENLPVQIHIAKLMEKIAGKPFGSGPRERIPQDHLNEHLDALSESFRFITQRKEGISLERIVESAEGYLNEEGDKRRGLIIDPWNEIEHWRPQGISETEYVSQQLSFIRNWARAHSVHVWIVAHPAKQPRDAKGLLVQPRPDMIAGSQHWWNKADCALTVWRDPEHPEMKTVDIIVQKVRFKHIGKPGTVSLEYDRITGRYSESERDLYVARG